MSMATAKQFTILIDPAGGVQGSGRKLDYEFERQATYQFAKQLRSFLLTKHPYLEIILSRNANQILEPLHSANFANQLQVDLFISLSFYKETAIKPNIFIFYFKNSHFFKPINLQNLEFYPYKQAFTAYFDRSQKYALLAQSRLQEPQYAHYFVCHNALAFPFKPLCGVTTPGISFEIGLKANGWELYLAPIGNLILEVAYDKI